MSTTRTIPANVAVVGTRPGFSRVSRNRQNLGTVTMQDGVYVARRNPHSVGRAFFTKADAVRFLVAR